jgi:hypothetical protein
MDTANTTTLKTEINREYALRFLGVALLFIAFSGWFLYDGLWGYARVNESVAPVTATLTTQNLSASDWMNTAKTGTAPLTAAFEAAGLSVPAHYADTFQSWIRAGDPRAEDVAAAQAVLSKPVYSEDEIRGQFVSAAIGLLAALGLMVIVWIRKMTQMVLTDTELWVYFGKTSQQFPLDSIVEVDTKQWEKRGILKIVFAKGRVTLDAWHHSGVRPIAEKLIAKNAQ